MERRITQVLLILFSIGILACQEVKYPDPQPSWKSEKKRFPKKMRGTYVNEKGEKAIEINEFTAALNEGDKYVSSIDLRSDTVQIKKWRAVYFVNIKEKEEEYWNGAFVEVEKDTIFLSYMDESIELLEKLTKVQRENADGDYIINPERNEWKAILEQMSFTTTKYVKN